MALSTSSLASSSARHPWRVIGIWAVALVASFLLIGTFLSDALTNEAKVTSHPESARGKQLIEDKLRGPTRVNEAVIIQSATLRVDDPAFKAYVQGIQGKVQALGSDVIESSTSFYESGDTNLVSADRRTTLVPLIMAGDVDQATKNIKKVLQIVDEANQSGQFHVNVSGFASVSEDFNKAVEQDLQRSEFGTLPLALIILIVVFGAVVAALVPLALSFVAILVAVALTAVIGQQFQFTFFVTNMILMMGLAVGIDYCLFIVSRFREERARGVEKQDAITLAAATAGRAVLFSGITVVVALMGLLIVPQTIFRSLAGGAILVVLAAVAASLTLLPAVISLLGDNVDRLRIPFVQHAQQAFDEERRGGFWDRVAHTVMARPVISIVVRRRAPDRCLDPLLQHRARLCRSSAPFPTASSRSRASRSCSDEFAGGQVYPAEVVIDGTANSAAGPGRYREAEGDCRQGPGLRPDTLRDEPGRRPRPALDPDGRRPQRPPRHERDRAAARRLHSRGLQRRRRRRHT